MSLKLKKYLLCSFLFFLCGCSLVNEAIQINIEEKASIKKGAQITRNDGLYTLNTVDDNYFIIELQDGIILRPKGISVYFKGDYVVRLFNEEKNPAMVRSDLEKSFNWITNKFVEKKIGFKLKELFTEKRVFLGKDALYKEFFIAGNIKNGVVKQASYAYSSLIFYNKGYLYWIYHSDPLETLEPRVEQKTRDKFQEFMKYFRVGE